MGLGEDLTDLATPPPNKCDAPTPSGRSRHLGQVVAEAVAAATVYAELAQCGGAGQTLGEATGVVSFNHS